MNHMTSIARFAGQQCARFTVQFRHISRAQDSTQQILNKTRALTSTFSFVFDSAGTLWARALQRLRASRLRLACSVALVIGISLCLPMGSASSGSIDAINPKTYIRLSMDHKQASCLLTLYGKESAFNQYAIGNLKGKYHVYGIPQLKNPIIYEKSAIEQVRYGIKYIHHRYNGDTCMALHHWKVWGWH